MGINDLHGLLRDTLREQVVNIYLGLKFTHGHPKVHFHLNAIERTTFPVSKIIMTIIIMKKKKE